MTTSAAEESRADYLPAVSVIIPTYRRVALLGKQLSALAAQDYEGRWEIVVADNDGDPEVRRLGESFADRVDIRVIDAGLRPGGGAARNAGVAVARASRLIFIDDDDEADPAFVRRMAAALDIHPFVAGQLGHERLNHNWVARALPPWQTDRLMDLWGFLPHANGCNIGIRRDVFVRAGGWPEHVAHSDDVAFCWAVGLTGADLHFAPGALVHYRHRSSARAYLHQEWRTGRGDLQLYARFGRHGMPFPRPGWGLPSKGRFLAELLHARSRADLLVWLGTATRILGRCPGQLPGRGRRIVDGRVS